MADLIRSVRGRKHPRNSGKLDNVTQFVNLDQYDKSLLHFNGPNGSNSIIDQLGHTWVAAYDAKLSTSIFKFGESSLVLDGIEDFIYTLDYPDFTIGTLDFTLEFWIIFSSVNTAILYDGRPASSIGKYITVFVSGTNLAFFTDGLIRIIGSTTLVVNNWYHIVLARSGTNTKLFLNGVQEGATYSPDNNDYINGVSSRPIIGSNGDVPGANCAHGFIDEFRLSKGIARWTSNFTPPTQEYGGP